MSRPTVANYLAVLETTKVAVVVRPFSTRRASEIVHAPKVYGFDTGFVRILRGWGELREEDLGSLWEHYVLGEILAVGPAAHVRYWRTARHQEVDLVVVPPGAAPIAIECKWRADGSEDLRGLKAFRRAYPEGQSYVVASNVGRPFTRGLIGRLTVRYIGLDGLGDLLRGGVAGSALR